MIHRFWKAAGRGVVVCALIFALGSGCGGGSVDSESDGLEDSEDSNDSDIENQGGELDLDSCEGSALFTVAPLDSESYMSITPLGNLSPSAHTFPTVHTYMMLVDKTIAAPVYAPGEITITQISSMTKEENGLTDYVIRFSSCREVSGYFDHVTTLSEELASQVGDFSDCRRYDPGDGFYVLCDQDVSFTVSAGVLLGYAGGPTSTGSAALDFGLRDTRISPITYLSNREMSSDLSYVVCPYDYYEAGPVHETLFGKLREARTAEPFCGTVDVDVASTAQGRWYREGLLNGSSEDGHLALVPSNFDPDVGVLSVGSSDVGEIKGYHFDFSSSGLVRRSFQSVTSNGSIYCYDQLRTGWGGDFYGGSLQGFLFLQMIDSETLKIERVEAGSCPADTGTLSFSSAAVTFIR